MEENQSQQSSGPASTPAYAASDSGSSMKVIIGIIIAAAAVAGGVYLYLQNTESPAPQGFSLNEQLGAGVAFEAPEYPETVATVNGKTISGADMRVAVTQVAQAAAAQGANPSDPTVLAEIEAQAIDILINTELLAQSAESSGVSISDEAVDAEFAQMEGQFASPEEFASAIAEIGMTPEEVKEDIRIRQTIDAYLEANTEVGQVTVSEEEVSSTYDSLTQGAADAPPLDEVYAPLEQQLVAQKEQEIVTGVIDGLKADADIEITLE